jgi:hypothetical protein
MTEIIDFQLRMGDGTAHEQDAYYDLSSPQIEDGDTLIYPHMFQSGGAGSQYLHVDAGAPAGARTTGPFGNGIAGTNDTNLSSDGTGSIIRTHTYDNSASLECSDLPFTAVGYNLGAAGSDGETDAFGGILFRGGTYVSLDDDDHGNFLGVPQAFPTVDSYSGSVLADDQIAIFIAWAQDITSLGSPANAAYTLTTDNPDAVELSVLHSYTPSAGAAKGATLVYYVPAGKDPSSTLTWESNIGSVNTLGGWCMAVVTFSTPFDAPTEAHSSPLALPQTRLNLKQLPNRVRSSDLTEVL